MEQPSAIFARKAESENEFGYDFQLGPFDGILQANSWENALRRHRAASRWAAQQPMTIWTDRFQVGRPHMTPESIPHTVPGVVDLIERWYDEPRPHGADVIDPYVLVAARLDNASLARELWDEANAIYERKNRSPEGGGEGPEQSSILVYADPNSVIPDLEIGPFNEPQKGSLITRWAETLRSEFLQRGETKEYAAPVGPPLLQNGAYHTVAPEDIPTDPGKLADFMDTWPENCPVDLYTVVIAATGDPVEGNILWGRAGEIYDLKHNAPDDGDGPDDAPVSADTERERIAALVNDELEGTAGNLEPGDTPGHVAYDAVMRALANRAEARPGGPAREVMNAFIEVIGLVHLLDGLTGCGRVPFEDNVHRAAEQIAAYRALLAEMLVAGSVRIEAALAESGLIAVSPRDLERAGVPADVIAKLRLRMEAHR